MSKVILEAEIERLIAKTSLYGKDTVWKQNEFSEILPFPKPLSLSLLRSLAGHNGATGMACRELGLPYNSAIPIEDYIETIFGRTFVNEAAQKRLTEGKQQNPFQRLASSVKFEAETKTFYRKFRPITAEINSDYNSFSSIKPEELPPSHLVNHAQKLVQALNVHYRHVVKAGLFAQQALDKLRLSAGEEQFTELLQADGHEIANKDQTALEILEFRDTRLAEFSAYGAETEYELACPRYKELQNQPPSYPGKSSSRHPIPTGASSRTLNNLFLFKVYESLKVIYKTLLLRMVHLLRTAMLGYDRLFALGDATFYLQFQELLPTGPDSKALEAITERKTRESAFQTINVTSVIRPAELSKLLAGTISPSAESLKGVNVNALPFEGLAVQCKSREDLAGVKPGQIIVVQNASPDLIAVFNVARGIITETGGLLSHLAIIARETGFPLVLQVRNATQTIKDGDSVNIDSDGYVTRK